MDYDDDVDTLRNVLKPSGRIFAHWSSTLECALDFKRSTMLSSEKSKTHTSSRVSSNHHSNEMSIGFHEAEPCRHLREFHHRTSHVNDQHGVGYTTHVTCGRETVEKKSHLTVDNLLYKFLNRHGH